MSVELVREGDRLVVRLRGFAALYALRGSVSAPLAAATSVRAVWPYENVHLHLRLWGTGGFGYYYGTFWRRGRGRCFVARCSRRDAVEIEFDGQRYRQWIVEVPSAVATVAELMSWGISGV